MKNRREKFGALVRNERLKKKLGLRQMAKQIGVSPTYLSMVERDAFPPPAEDKVRAIAVIIERDPDALLALAGRVSSDVTAIVRQHPREIAELLRAVKEFPKELIAELAQMVSNLKQEPPREVQRVFRESWGLRRLTTPDKVVGLPRMRSEVVPAKKSRRDG